MKYLLAGRGMWSEGRMGPASPPIELAMDVAEDVVNPGDDLGAGPGRADIAAGDPRPSP
jgi:hypothetical protein